MSTLDDATIGAFAEDANAIEVALAQRTAKCAALYLEIALGEVGHALRVLVSVAKLLDGVKTVHQYIPAGRHRTGTRRFRNAIQFGKVGMLFSHFAQRNRDLPVGCHCSPMTLLVPDVGTTADEFRADLWLPNLDIDQRKSPLYCARQFALRVMASDQQF